MIFIAGFFILGILFSIYLIGILIAFIYECKMRQTYEAKKKELEKIKNMRISFAAIYAKTFKVDQDYNKIIEILNRKQKEILKRMPFFRQAYL